MTEKPDEFTKRINKELRDAFGVRSPGYTPPESHQRFNDWLRASRDAKLLRVPVEELLED